MKRPVEHDSLVVDAEISLLEDILNTSDRVFVKKLSNNDRDWAYLINKHQAGVYIPPEQRDSGFFPTLHTKDRSSSGPGTAAIHEAFFRTEWPQCGEAFESRLVHYTSKGEETHLTGLPRAAFSELAPASLLVIGRAIKKNSSVVYRCLTVDSRSDDAEVLFDWLSIDSSVVATIRDPKLERGRRQERSATFLEQALFAIKNGAFDEFSLKHSVIPSTEELASLANTQYMRMHGLTALDPFKIDKPGDALRTISRIIEWEIFKDLQMKARSLGLIRIVVGDDFSTTSIEKVVTSLVTNFQHIDALLLSASQQRKSRAGYSFEHHIEKMLSDGLLPYKKQVVLEAKRRPDFVMPTTAFLKSQKRAKGDALVLSAKTTLRERWKQVPREVANCALFLATVDENIAGNAIEHMCSLEIVLVVPESLKNSDVTEYKNHRNVIGFREFFDEEIKGKRWAQWDHAGLFGAK